MSSPLTGLTSRLMKKYEPSKCIITEITITNVQNTMREESRPY
ncbi:MAG TPA: hypothetical protein VEW92_11920 [Nitrososphaeraceae archaeon]|nr:hypothetical protein [Nitrososphaeraceae archaeon]